MKEFFKMFFASLLAVLAVAGGLVMVLFMVFAIAASVGSSGKKAHYSNAVLVLDLGAPISDKPTSKSPTDALSDALAGGGSRGYQLHSLLAAIRHAKGDPKIKGLLLTGNVQGGNYASGFAALRELRGAIEEFRAAKKPVWAYNMSYDEPTYYVASAAEVVAVHPFGLMEINGLASEGMYFAKAFEKYGVGVQVTRVGRYKSAVEPFMLDHMSDANREQLGKLLGDIWTTFVEAVSASRGLGPGTLQALVDSKAMLDAKGMLDAKLADRSVYFDELLDELKKVAGDKADAKTFSQVDVRAYIETHEGTPSFKGPGKGKGKIAVIYAEGEIVDGGSKQEVGGDHIGRLLRKARLDDEIVAVVLRVNSPGGSASASEVIQREVRLTRKEKPVVISMGTVAASGGYWISAYGDRIFAEPNTITGSIGVFGMLPNVQKLVNDVGVNIDTVRTGRYADMMTMFRPKSPEELALIQGWVDQIYRDFLDRVVEGRKLPRAKVEEIAQGRIWSGTEAKALGLVDELGGLGDAIGWVAKKASVEDSYTLVSYQAKRSPLEQLLESMNEDGEKGGTSVVVGEAKRVLGELQRLALLNDPRGVYARLPVDVNPR